MLLTFMMSRIACALSAWAAGKVSLVLSPDILEEYPRVGQELGVQYPDLEVALEPILALLAMSATIVDAPRLEVPVSEDPADDMFPAAALASRAQLIVSGDKLRTSPTS